MKLTDHISIEEATHTGTGLQNIPSEQQLAAMRLVAEKVFEPLRQHFGQPIRINSFFRSPAVNKAVGGVPSSQHVLGEAIDLHCDTVGDRVIFDYVRLYLHYDQVILEPTWVHVSYKATGNRQQALTAKKVNGKMIYSAV